MQYEITKHFSERAAERAIPAAVLADVLKNHRRVQNRHNPRVTLLIGKRVTISAQLGQKTITLLTCWWDTQGA